MDYRTVLIAPGRLSRRWPGSLVDRLEGPVEALGFWGAVAMPAAYLSLLVSGVEGELGLALFVSLVVAHLVALLVGHGYRRERNEQAPTDAR